MSTSLSLFIWKYHGNLITCSLELRHFNCRFISRSLESWFKKIVYFLFCTSDKFESFGVLESGNQSAGAYSIVLSGKM